MTVMSIQIENQMIGKKITSNLKCIVWVIAASMLMAFNEWILEDHFQMNPILVTAIFGCTIVPCAEELLRRFAIEFRMGLQWTIYWVLYEAALDYIAYSDCDMLLLTFFIILSSIAQLGFYKIQTKWGYDVAVISHMVWNFIFLMVL